LLSDEEFTTTNGILMGLGPTWPLLSLIHLFVVDYASTYCSKYARRFAKRATSIGGDDLVGFWPQELSDAYHRIWTDLNGQFSKGKSFVSAINRGNFAERTFLVDDGVVRFFSGVPLKGLTSASEKGLAFESLTDGQRIVGRRVLRTLFPSSWSSPLPTFPTSLGGSGLPPKRGNVHRCFASFEHRLAVGRYLYGSKPLDNLPPPPFMESGDKFSGRLRRQVEDALYTDVGRKAITVRREKSPVVLGSNERLLKAYLAEFLSHLVTLRLFDGEVPSMATPKADLVRFASSVRRWVRRSVARDLPSKLAVGDGVNRSVFLKRQLLVDSTTVVSPGDELHQLPLFFKKKVDSEDRSNNCVLQ
jgi:hypothetical protein